MKVRQIMHLDDRLKKLINVIRNDSNNNVQDNDKEIISHR